MLPSADRSAISCMKSSNSLIRASLPVNSGTVLLSCFSIVASSDLLHLVKVRGQTKTIPILYAQVCFIVYRLWQAFFTWLGQAQPLHFMYGGKNVVAGLAPARSHSPASMCRAQRSHNHRHHTQTKGYEKGQVYPVEKEGQSRRKLAHPTAIDEDFHHGCHGNRTQGEWEDDGDA